MNQTLFRRADSDAAGDGPKARMSQPVGNILQRMRSFFHERSASEIETSKLGCALNFASYWAFNRIPPRPRVLRIEITNHCNLQCIICDRSAMSRCKKQMDWPLFERVCRDAIEFGIPQIGLNRFGEPMLHPRLPEMIAFAKINGAHCVDFTTNGTLLDEDNIHRILEAGLDQIAVSIDGFDQSTYERIRRGASYAQVVAGVHSLLEIREKLKAATKVQLNFVCTKETIKEARAFYRYWRKQVDSFFFIPFMGYAGVQGMSPMARPRYRTKCYMLWYMIVSSVDGQAGVCCQGDPNHELDIGDLKKRTLRDVWNGPEARRIRRIHFERAWKELPVCASCDMTYPYTRWMQHYLDIYRRIHVV